MVISDVDSASTFTALTAVAGSNSYGTFSMSTAGVWTYTANSAQTNSWPAAPTPIASASPVPMARSAASR
ncbi:MAG: hypothetical protein IPO38_03675 [Rhodocyclaceae bacterium]|nr:hypothetical protein [Rhodocyclaceae bacterium]